MPSSKIQQYELLIPKIKSKAKTLKNRRNRKVQRINLASDLTLVLISATDLMGSPNIKKKNVFKIKEFFKDFVLEEAKIELEKSRCDYMALFSSLKSSIMEELDLIESTFKKLSTIHIPFAVNFFDDFSNGVFNDNIEFGKHLELLVAKFASKASMFSENEVFEKITKNFNEQKQKIIAFLKDINSYLSSEPARAHSIIFENSIIVKDGEHEMISQWVREEVRSLKKFELLFSTTKNGFKSAEFHRICNDKGPTIVFIETENGKRFGGYANCPWPKLGESALGDKCFLFSLNLREKYLSNDGVPYLITGDANWGPYFGDKLSQNGFALDNDCNNRYGSKSYCNIINSKCMKNRTCHDFAGGSTFSVKNYEVYLVK